MTAAAAQTRAVQRAVRDGVGPGTRVVRSTASELLAAPPGSVDPGAPLHVAGLDSVLAGQLRLRLKRDLDLHVPLADLLDDRPLIRVVRDLPNVPEPRSSVVLN